MLLFNTADLLPVPLMQELDEGHSMDTMYLDFSKAFDSVRHQWLPKTMSGYGMSGQALGWSKELLSMRRQRVVIIGEFSPWKPILSCVPQGSVLGHIIFGKDISEMWDRCSQMVQTYERSSIMRKTGQGLVTSGR